MVQVCLFAKEGEEEEGEAAILRACDFMAMLAKRYAADEIAAEKLHEEKYDLLRGAGLTSTKRKAKGQA